VPRLPDALMSYRDTTRRMTNSPGLTFKCCRCQQGKLITGRRKVGMLGRKNLYACKACLEDLN
jgi:predicted SprT family Zn-dependent metalloprotease